MIFYEIQGTIIRSTPKESTIQKLRDFPPNAELVVWEDRDILEVTTVEDKIESLVETESLNIGSTDKETIDRLSPPK